MILLASSFLSKLFPLPLPGGREGEEKRRREERALLLLSFPRHNPSLLPFFPFLSSSLPSLQSKRSGSQRGEIERGEQASKEAASGNKGFDNGGGKKKIKCFLPSITPSTYKRKKLLPHDSFGAMHDLVRKQTSIPKNECIGT